MAYLARIAYNKNGWQSPSGMDGKSGGKILHERMYYFGFDEWLFKKTMKIYGLHYGFIKAMLPYPGTQKEDVFVYTRIANGHQLVGMFSSVDCLTKDQAEDIRNDFLVRGWYKQAIDELQECYKNDTVKSKIAVSRFRRIFDDDPIEFINVSFKSRNYFPATKDAGLKTEYVGTARYSKLLYTVFEEHPNLEKKLKTNLVGYSAKKL